MPHFCLSDIVYQVLRVYCLTRAYESTLIYLYPPWLFFLIAELLQLFLNFGEYISSGDCRLSKIMSNKLHDAEPFFSLQQGGRQYRSWYEYPCADYARVAIPLPGFDYTLFSQSIAVVFLRICRFYPSTLSPQHGE